MHSLSLFSHKRTVSICCACILLAALFVGVLPFLSFTVNAADAVYQVRGVWVFNDSLDFSIPNQFVISVNFTSNGLSFVSFYYNQFWSSFYYLDGPDYQGSSNPQVAYQVSSIIGAVNGWQDTAWQTVDFGSSYQEVPEDFYNFLISNATHIVTPEDPVFQTNLSPSYSFSVGVAASPLSVSASITDDGVLSYQWYENTTNSTTGGTPISGATSASYTPSTDTIGTKYYYCTVTNTLGEDTSTVYSNVCAITVSVVPPKLPTVTSHFAQSYTYKIGDAAAELVVSATVADDGVLSYQWYVFEYTGSSADNYEPIPGATSVNYQPVLDFVGTRYYMCAVTNTLSNLTVSVDSNSVMITVKPVSYTLQAGQYECKSMVAGGATVFVPLAAWPDALDNTVNLMFRSGGQSFTQFSYKYDLIGSHSSYSIYYGSIKAYAYETVANPAGFTFDAYSLLFLEADQVVPTEFYDWFVSCFEYSGADEELPTYSTIIDIYDNAGTTLLHTFLFTGEGISPVVYGFVQLDGLKLMLDSGLSYDWSELPEDEEFLGFSTRTNATAAWFIPDETFTLGGQPETAHFELYLVFNTSVPVDKEYQSGILGWLERIWDVCSETFMWSDKLYHKAEDMADELAPSVQEKQVKGFLGIIDFSGIGDFFKSAYEGMSDFFGLGSLLTGEDSPFAWLKE